MKTKKEIAIEFAEWCACEFWIFKVYDDFWVNYGGVDLRKLKSKELFLEFINSLNKQYDNRNNLNNKKIK
jgi:hypothetical protein